MRRLLLTRFDSKHWPSDGIARRVFLAAASISAAVMLIAGVAQPTKVIWS